MFAETQLRVITILIGVSVVACAGVPPFLPFVPKEQPSDRLLAVDCPYSSVYVAVSTNGASRDARIAERVRLVYADTLGAAGFQVVTAPEQAYWSAFSLVTVSGRVDSVFAWSVYMMATHELGGRPRTPLRFAVEGDDPAELSGFVFLKEIRLMEVDSQVRAAAEKTAVALLPHTHRMCMTWTQHENLRQELAQEILRVREARNRKRLWLGVEGATGP